MEDNIEEFEFSEWTDSLEDEFMETESALVHGSMQNNITQPLEKNNGRCIENRDLKSRKLSCLGESCQGKMFHIQENSLLSGYLRSLDGMAESSNEPIIQLFGSKFAAGSALACKTDTLFYLLRQQIFKLMNMQSEEGMLPLSSEMNSKCIKIRKECAHFMAYVHNYINRYCMSHCDVGNLPDGQFIKSVLHMPAILRQELGGIVQFLGRLTELSITSLIRTDMRLSADRPSATFHMFHVYLDMVCNVIQALWEILNKQDKESCNNLQEIDDIILSIKNIAMALLWDLTALAATSFNMVPRSDLHKTSPFLCSCVCEVWVSLIHTLDQLSGQYNLDPFWSLLSSILQQVLSPGDNSSQNTNEEEISDVQSDFTCNDPDHFCWWLVAKVAPLYWFNDGHVYAVRRKGSKPGNWVFITELLKSSLSSLKSGQEEYHRRFYLRCCLAVSCHWSANTGIVVWLWEYFHKRLNELFNIPSHTLHGMTTVNLTVTQWMEQCAGRCQDHLSSLDQENSFSLLLRIIAVHLNKIQLSGSQQGWKQMKGRFYSKFTKKRMEELSETGTRHFLNLFLTLSYIAADLEDVATKMCHFLDLLDFSSESPGKKVLIVKGLFTLMLIYKERNMDFAYLSNKMSTMFWLVCKEFSPEKQVRDKRQLWDLVMVYLDGTQEILEHKNKHDLSEFKLIESPGFKYLFEGCRGNELQHLLMFVQSVLALVRPLQDNTAVSSKQEMSGYLWSNMFPYLQKLLSRDRTIMMPLSTILADTMAGFTLLALERYPDTVNRSVSFKNLMSDYGIKDELPASFVCRFLGHVITARDAEMVIEAESLQSQVIHAWFRCLLQLPTNEESCFTLSRAVAQLPEMASLIKNQEGFGLSENSETTLKQFIMALASHYQSLTTFEQIIQFRTRAQLYFGNVEKYIEVFINTGKPQDSLRLAFSLCGSMFKYCYKIIYSKSIQLCLLPKLLDQLILPLHTNKVLPVVQQHASRYLHMFLQGLSQLDFRKDEFIKRKIRKILDNYFHKSLMTTSPPATVNNPFMAVLKDSLEKEPTKESSDFRQFCISYISEEFFQLPQPPQKLNVTLHFMVDLFKRTQSLQQIARNTEALLVPILGCLLACETSQPGNEPPNIRRQATDILRMMIDSSKQDENYKSILSPLLKTFVANNLQKCQGQVFATLKPLTVLDPPLITGLIPDFKQSMMQSETSRGVGTDNQLRKAFHNLLKHLGQGE